MSLVAAAHRLKTISMVQRSDNATKLIFIKCANKVVTNNIEGEASATEKQVFQSAILRDLVSL